MDETLRNGRDKPMGVTFLASPDDGQDQQSRGGASLRCPTSGFMVPVSSPPSGCSLTNVTTSRGGRAKSRRGFFLPHNPSTRNTSTTANSSGSGSRWKPVGDTLPAPMSTISAAMNTRLLLLLLCTSIPYSWALPDLIYSSTPSNDSCFRNSLNSATK